MSNKVNENDLVRARKTIDVRGVKGVATVLGAGQYARVLELDEDHAGSFVDLKKLDRETMLDESACPALARPEDLEVVGKFITREFSGSREVSPRFEYLSLKRDLGGEGRVVADFVEFGSRRVTWVFSDDLTFVEVMGILGREGWDLVMRISSGAFIFKRQVQCVASGKS